MIFAVLLVILPICSGKTSLEHFVARQNLFNYTINIINANESKPIWIEYVYNFQKDGKIRNSAKELFIASNKSKFEMGLVDIIENEFKYRAHHLHLDKNVKNVDVIVCCSCNQDEFTIFKRSLPLFESHYFMLYSRNHLRSKTKDIFVITFVGSLWFGFLFMLLLLAICLRIATKQYSKIYETSKKWPWVDISLWTIAVACQQGLSFTPSKFASCLLFLLGYVSSYLLYTGFAASITSVLLHQNVDDNALIYKGKLVCFPYYPSAIETKNVEELLEQVKFNKTIGIVPENFIDETKTVLENIFLKKLPVIYKAELLFRSPNLREEFNRKILRFKEVGLLKRIFHVNTVNVKSQDGPSTYSQVSLQHVGSALLLLASGALLSIFFLICEFLYAFINN